MKMFRKIIFLCLASLFAIPSLYSIEKVWSSIGPEGCKINDVGFYGQGLFLNANDGWRASGAGLADSYVRSLLVSPADPGIVYAGTAKGVFRSLNGGIDWSPIETGFSTEVFLLKVDPLNPQTIYAATKKGVWVNR